MVQKTKTQEKNIKNLSFSFKKHEKTIKNHIKIISKSYQNHKPKTPKKKSINQNHIKIKKIH